jgi:multidrug efflux system membrane fusion protein
VQVQQFTAQDRIATLTLRGRTMANQRVEMKAEVAGQVEALPMPKGSRVRQGDIVCKIEDGVRPARVLQANALLAQAELDYDAANKLSTSGYAAATRVKALQAALDAAKATLKEAELNLERTKIKAPFDGVIEDELVKAGDYLNVGNPCVTVTTVDPILVVGQVSERDVAALETGMTARGRLVTGDEFEGQIRFISPSAQAETRTFRVEIEVANPDGKLRHGVTARMDIPLEPVRAHRLAPSYLTLNDAGEVGVRTLDDDGRVRFLAVKILDDEPGAVWVAGLPDKVTVITAGQDFVGEGELVTPITANAERAS